MINSKHITICLLMCGFLSVQGQNLVPNPDFEEFFECPSNYTQYGKKLGLKHWYTPTKGSPDYFNSCSKFNVSVPVNFMGHLFAKSGNAYTGILLAEKPARIHQDLKPMNEREYIQVKLQTSLKMGCSYQLKYYFCLAQHSTFSINRLAVCLTQKPTKKKKVVKCNNEFPMDTLNLYAEVGTWIQVCDTIEALGGEEYLTIGNFHDDASIRYLKQDNSMYRKSIQHAMEVNGYAYYHIDDVSLIPLD